MTAKNSGIHPYVHEVPLVNRVDVVQDVITVSVRTAYEVPASHRGATFVRGYARAGAIDVISTIRCGVSGASWPLAEPFVDSVHEEGYHGEDVAASAA
jgi:hypothetical protein